MARTRRKETRVTYTMSFRVSRGAGRQLVFEDDGDRELVPEERREALRSEGMRLAYARFAMATATCFLSSKAMPHSSAPEPARPWA